MSRVLCVAAFVFLLGLSAADRAQAFLVTYTYVGSTYTQTNAPVEPGFTLTDYVTATITLDSSLWGSTANFPADSSGTINSGPWQVGLDTFSVTTDLSGAIIAWNLSGAIPGLDIAISGNLDGSGLDTIFGDRPTNGATFYSASVQYQPEQRTTGNGWTIAAVPEPSSLLLMLIAGVCFMIARKTSAKNRDLTVA